MLRWLLLPVALVVLPAGVSAVQAPDRDAAVATALQQAEQAIDRRRWRQARSALERAVDAYEAGGRGRPLLEAQIEAGWADFYQGYRRWSRAAEHSARAYELTVAGGASRHEIADAAYTLGYLTYRNRRFEDARDAFGVAVDGYRTELPPDSRRRWRANGWFELASLAVETHGGNIDEDARTVNNQWFFWASPLRDESLGVSVPYEAWDGVPPLGWFGLGLSGESDGFAVVRLRFSADGAIANYEVLSSYPSDMMEVGLEHVMEHSRADPAQIEAGTDYVVIYSALLE